MDRKTLTFLALLFLAGALLYQGAVSLFGGEGPEPGAAEQRGPYPVERVVDGDTVILRIDGVRERVRLIGIDTPESVPDNADRIVPYGAVAAAFTEEALEGRDVMIETDAELRDSYDRLLAYVYVDGEMLNARLLQEGHARVTIVPPNDRYEDWFRELEETAREAERGLWGQ